VSDVKILIVGVVFACRASLVGCSYYASNQSTSGSTLSFIILDLFLLEHSTIPRHSYDTQQMMM